MYIGKRGKRNYDEQNGESDDDALFALAVKRGIEFEIGFDELQRVPEARPVGRQRNEEEGRVDADEDAGVVEVLDADVEPVGRRQVGPVVDHAVGPELEEAANERGAVQSHGRQDHQRARQQQENGIAIRFRFLPTGTHVEAEDPHPDGQRPKARLDFQHGVSGERTGRAAPPRAVK